MRSAGFGLDDCGAILSGWGGSRSTCQALNSVRAQVQVTFVGCKVHSVALTSTFHPRNTRRMSRWPFMDANCTAVESVVIGGGPHVDISPAQRPQNFGAAFSGCDMHGVACANVGGAQVDVPTCRDGLLGLRGARRSMYHWWCVARRSPPATLSSHGAMTLYPLPQAKINRVIPFIVRSRMPRLLLSI